MLSRQVYQVFLCHVADALGAAFGVLGPERLRHHAAAGAEHAPGIFKTSAKKCQSAFVHPNFIWPRGLALQCGELVFQAIVGLLMLRLNGRMWQVHFFARQLIQNCLVAAPLVGTLQLKQAAAFGLCISWMRIMLADDAHTVGALTCLLAECRIWSFRWAKDALPVAFLGRCMAIHVGHRWGGNIVFFFFFFFFFFFCCFFQFSAFLFFFPLPDFASPRNPIHVPVDT